MKRIFFLLPILCFLAFSACEEIAPEINPLMGPVDEQEPPDVGDQERQVLIEEFTGVRCVNCPAGAVEIENLLNIYGVQLVAISIHAGGFSPPYAESLYDFRTEEGDQILDYLGEPLGYPSAVVDRKLFDGEFDLQVTKGQWAGFIADELLEAPKVKIGVETSFDEGTRELEAEVFLFVEEDILDPDVRLSVMVTESGVKDYQETPDGKISDYEHKHILRDMMTNWDGNGLTSPLLIGDEITKSFSLTLPEEWDEDKSEVVVFVHLGGATKDVLQATQVHAVE